MNRRIVFLDIDGTLTAFGEGRPPESAVKAIRMARDNGNLVYICTGRNRQMHYPMLQYGMDGAVGAAGALAYAGKERIWSKPIPETSFHRLIDAFHREQISCMPECEYVVYADEMLYANYEKFKRKDAGQEQEDDVFHVEPIADYKGEPVYKMVFLGASADSIERLRPKLEDEFQFILQKNMSEDGSIGGEMIIRGVDKALGMLKVCEHYGLSMADTVAFGDSTNDIEILETAALSVCMGNGSDDAKAAADLVCPDVHSDGLYHGFKMAGLI